MVNLRPGILNFLQMQLILFCCRLVFFSLPQFWPSLVFPSKLNFTSFFLSSNTKLKWNKILAFSKINRHDKKGEQCTSLSQQSINYSCGNFFSIGRRLAESAERNDGSRKNFFGGINIFFFLTKIEKNETRKIFSKFCHEMAAWA